MKAEFHTQEKATAPAEKGSASVEQVQNTPNHRHHCSFPFCRCCFCFLPRLSPLPSATLSSTMRALATAPAVQRCVVCHRCPSSLSPIAVRRCYLCGRSLPQLSLTLAGCLNQPTDSIAVSCFNTLASFQFFDGQSCAGQPAFTGVTQSGACGPMALFESSYVVICEDVSASPRPSTRPTPVPSPSVPQWGQLGQNALRTGRSPFPGPTSPAILWQTSMNSNLSPPTIDSKGFVYVGAAGLYCLDGRTGVVQWQFNGAPGAGVQGAPVLTGDGLVIFEGGTVMYALNGTNGNIAWTLTVPSLTLSSMALGANGFVYCNNGYTAFAVDTRKAKIVWSLQFASATAGSPAIGPGNVVYVSAADSLYALAGATGKTLWQTTGLAPYSAPAIAVTGTGSSTLFFGTVKWTSGVGWSGSVAAVDGATGKVKWSYPTGAPMPGAPALGPNGYVYISGGPTAYAFHPEKGTVMWATNMTTIGFGWNTDTLVDSEGIVYTAVTQSIGNNATLCALNGETGDFLWSYVIGTSLVKSAALGASGGLYIACQDSVLCAFASESG